MIRSLTLFLLLIVAAPATAQSVQDQIVSQLRSQGFEQIELSRTFLGRIRVVAVSDTLERELVFNPKTGEILRDYWEERDGPNARVPRVFSPPRDKSSQPNSGDRIDDDDREDDRDADDDKDADDKDADDKDEDDERGEDDDRDDDNDKDDDDD